MLVRIERNWKEPDIIRQTPGNSGEWDDISFTTDAVSDCDYLIVLNQPQRDLIVNCSKERVWAIMQEPPNPFFRIKHRGDRAYYRVYTTDSSLHGERYINTHPCLPWHIKKNYDELINSKVPKKIKQISWITSNIDSFEGHRVRIKFLEYIRTRLDFELFGRGYCFIPDKWDGLSPYKYSFAVENFSNQYYWSEKISDCFLSWTMPIYYGCTRIMDYFPAESLIQIDINDPDEAIYMIMTAIKEKKWEKNLEAIRESRDLVLNKYQIFPFLAHEINEFENQKTGTDLIKPIFIPTNPRLQLSFIERIWYFAKLLIPKQIRRKLFDFRKVFKT
jgi:hypothetical protein